LSASTSKKVVVQRFDRESLTGYVSLATYQQPGGVELLSTAGSLSLVPYVEIKMVCFVRDFLSSDPAGERRIFTYRPKTAGLWVRLRFKDEDVLDGILANDLTQLDPYGFSVLPPDLSSNNQRLFVPRIALASLQVMAVVGSPQYIKRKPKPAAKEQIGLFE
jgi:hypothetical protein